MKLKGFLLKHSLNQMSQELHFVFKSLVCKSQLLNCIFAQS